MTVATQSPTTRPAAKSSADRLIDLLPELSPGQSVAMTDLCWGDYLRVLAGRDRLRRGARVTFDAGRLEIMTISSPHDRLKYYLGRIIDTLSEELSIEIVGQGQTTISREDLDRGFEPDAWYYVQNATRMRTTRDLDFTRDPPPDLAVDVEISRSALDRLDLYARMGVPEVWRHDFTTLTVLHLNADATYSERLTSLSFPQVPLSGVGVAIAEAEAHGSLIAFRNFRAWVRSILESRTQA